MTNFLAKKRHFVNFRSQLNHFTSDQDADFFPRFGMHDYFVPCRKLGWQKFRGPLKKLKTHIAVIRPCRLPDHRSAISRRISMRIFLSESQKTPPCCERKIFRTNSGSPRQKNAKTQKIPQNRGYSNSSQNAAAKFFAKQTL